MAQSKITLIGLEQFLNPDHSVFEAATFPEGIDTDTLKGAIFLRCQEFELLYPDPEFMIPAVDVWAKKNYWTFDKWVKLLSKTYDPLYNKDYYEDIRDTHEGAASSSGTTSQSDDHTRTNNLTHSEDYTRTDNLKSETDGTVTHAEKAFNDSNMVDTTEDTTDGEVNHTGTQRNAGSGSDTGTVRDAGTTSGTYGNTNNDSYVNAHTYHGYGNIGITSAQELFLRETDVARFNLYEQIADLFCQEFCIMVY